MRSGKPVWSGAALAVAPFHIRLTGMKPSAGKLVADC